MNKNIVIPVVICIVFIVGAIVLIIGMNSNGWFSGKSGNAQKSNNYVKNMPQLSDEESTDKQKELMDTDKDNEKDKSAEEKYYGENQGAKDKKEIKKIIKNDNSTTTNKFNITNKYDYSKTTNKYDYSNTKKSSYKRQTSVKDKKVPETQKSYKEQYEKKTVKPEYTKTVKSDNATFHAEGEYISEEEYLYRVSLIKDLSIKTIVIDRLTKGNGISQEYFKVAYSTNMIPAKILEELVESMNFRKLIPQKYLNEETKLNGLLKGDKVIIKNSDIAGLLVLWTQGKLIPVQKAWETLAEK
jgi:hypothetical protein